ncbi:tyrosine-type recombinase/integrase [Brevundimonas bullata]|uniref:tyrosine-type recombinase/integrase n=1 Tax=Brevundimonas bullata TaxID=13160 RepID=UPI000E0ADAA6|nr:tyrosine-type recombinase/integrase [Brevundimonas bullata]WQE36744.1 tyrosine-type recombinase/integrase [Brevundimonas bullata]
MGRGLKVIGFHNVTPMTDRHGKVRYRFRKKGFRSVYLPGLPGSPEFAEAYEAARSGGVLVIGERRLQAGTIHALAVAFYQSAEWMQFSTETQRSYRQRIEQIRKGYGDQQVRGLKPDHIMKMRDKRKDTPVSANNMVKTLHMLMGFAVLRNLRLDNPAASIKPLKIKSDGWHTWTESELAQFETRWAIGTRERLASDLLAYTAQRSADVRQMGRQHVSGGLIRVKQQKTGAELWIPIHTRLATSLAKVPGNQMLFLATNKGTGYTAKSFGDWFKDACIAAGLPHCSAHGLRKTAATRLADAGCTEAQIQSITGHKTSAEVQRYTRARNQKQLAADAMATIDGANGEQEMSNPADQLDKSPAMRLK